MCFKWTDFDCSVVKKNALDRKDSCALNLEYYQICFYNLYIGDYQIKDYYVSNWNWK